MKCSQCISNGMDCVVGWMEGRETNNRGNIAVEAVEVVV